MNGFVILFILVVVVLLVCYVRKETFTSRKSRIESRISDYCQDAENEYKSCMLGYNFLRSGLVGTHHRYRDDRYGYRPFSSGCRSEYTEYLKCKLGNVCNKSCAEITGMTCAEIKDELTCSSLDDRLHMWT